MNHNPSIWAQPSARGSAAAVLLLVGFAASGPTSAWAEGPSGRIDFAGADLPPATVEVDLSQEIFSDLFGLGDAAIAGVIESLTNDRQSHESEATELAAEKLSAARQIVQLAKDVVQEVRLRVYEDYPEEAGNAADLSRRFDQQLSDGDWDNVVRVRDGDESVNVSFLRVEGSILGVFVAAADGSDVVLANIVCDISPENVKGLTSAATKIGLEHGLREELEDKLRHLR